MSFYASNHGNETLFDNQDILKKQTNNTKITSNAYVCDKPYRNIDSMTHLQLIREKILSITNRKLKSGTGKDFIDRNKIENNNNSFISDNAPIKNKKSLDTIQQCSQLGSLDQSQMVSSKPSQCILLVEVYTLKRSRIETFSHWARQLSPLTSQMIRAGFFGCNVGDRVVCIYCNIICQQWDQNTDNPCEVHKTISPKCPYIIAMLAEESASTSPLLAIINEAPATATNSNPLLHTTIVYAAAIHQQFIEIPKRFESFSEWSTENMPSVDDLVKAGFFYTGKDTVVTCFYCNGSLQNWGATDNPMVEHARWFPHCAYAKQLCGSDLYQRIQESKRALQERTRNPTRENPQGIGGDNRDTSTLFIPDESTLSRLVAARLDLPSSQRLLDQNFKLSVIKRCWEDQLRLKHSDFISDSDLWMACTILRKQIEIINGNKDNIIVPSIAMKRIREKKELPMDIPREISNSKKEVVSHKELPKEHEVEMDDVMEVEKSHGIVKKETSNPSLANACVLCRKEEKRLACIPCGHLVSCSTCVKSIRSCPVCRLSVEAFVRVYL